MPEIMGTKIAFALTWILIKVQDLREQIMGIRGNIKHFARGQELPSTFFVCTNISCQLSNVFSSITLQFLNDTMSVHLCICTINYCILADMEIAQMIVITPAAIPASQHLYYMVEHSIRIK